MRHIVQDQQGQVHGAPARGHPQRDQEGGHLGQLQVHLRDGVRCGARGGQLSNRAGNETSRTFVDSSRF